MIIKAIKETLGQMFYSPEATGSWVIEEKNIECAIDEETVDCSEVDSTPYVGVPAPAYLEDDEWFGESILTEKGMDLVQQEAQIKQQHEEQKQELVAAGVIIEDENIHQKMYEMATKNWNTVGEFLGGSENFQGGSENVHR